MLQRRPHNSAEESRQDRYLPCPWLDCDYTRVRVVGEHPYVGSLLQFRRLTMGHEIQRLSNCLPNIDLIHRFQAGRLSMATASVPGMFFTSTHKGQFGSRSVIRGAVVGTLLTVSALNGARAQGRAAG